MSTIKTQISVKTSGDGVVDENEWKPTLMTNTAGPAVGAFKTLLGTGVNSLTVPTGAMGITVMPPSTSTARLNFPGVSGGTGMMLRTGHASTNPLPTGTTAVLLASNIEELAYIHWG